MVTLRLHKHRNLIFAEYPHKFIKKLKNVSTVEHEKVEFEVETEAEDADVTWYINGKKVNPDDKRFQVIVDKNKRKLVIKDALLSDAGEVCAKTNVDDSACKLKVSRKGADQCIKTTKRQ